MKRVARWLVLFAMLAPLPAHAAIQLEVVPNPGPGWVPGERSGVPLPRLAEAIRAARNTPSGAGAPVTVELAPGTYRLPAPVTLGPAEAPEGAGVTIVAGHGGPVILSGALPVTGLMPVAGRPEATMLPEAARGEAMVADLPPEWRGRWGAIARRGLGLPAQPLQAELFFRGNRLPLARWPNAGFATVRTVADGEAGTRVTTDGPLPAGIERETDPWAFGFWAAAWAPFHLPIASVDPSSSTLTLQPPAPRYGFKKDRRFYVENAVSALDSPGEWYLDRHGGKLFLWPPALPGPGDTELSLTETLFELSDAADVTVDGLVFEAARGDAIVITGGRRNHLRNCIVRNIGNVAIRLGGIESGVQNCDIHDIGDSGVLLDGGDRPTLQPGGLSLADSKIHRYGQWTTAPTAAAWIYGVGNKVVGNQIYDAPNKGIFFTGNDHLIEGNLIHDVVQATNDAAAIQIWGDWAQRGTSIRGNTICNVHAAEKFAIGIYLDLLASGIEVVGNRLLNAQWGMLINGGSDNLVRDNIIVGSEIPIRFDAIGLSWSRKAVLDPNSSLRGPLAALPIDGPLWTARYPGLAKVLDDDPGMPKRNVFEGNTIYGANLGRYDAKAASQTIMRDNRLRPLPAAPQLGAMFPPVCLPGGAS